MIKKIISLIAASAWVLIAGLFFLPLPLWSSAVLELNPLASDAGLDLACYGRSESLEALVYNPAYAFHKGQTIGVSGGLLGLDMNYLSLAYSGKAPFGSAVGWGAMVKYLGTGSIDGFDEAGLSTGPLSATDLDFTGILGFRIVGSVSAGLRFHVLNEKISESSIGYGLDLAAGASLKLGEKSDMNLGVTVLNAYSRLWDLVRPAGIGAGLLFSSGISPSSRLEYGLGLKADEEGFYTAGGGARFSSSFHLSGSSFHYKIGAGYYYSDKSEALEGLRTGIELDFKKQIGVAYDFFLKPWGTENRITLSFNL